MYGYKIKNGEVSVVNEEARILRVLFANYLSGMSMQNAAENAGLHIPHCSVKKLLTRKRYIGDAYYPAIIDRDTFYLAQQVRETAAEKVKPKGENTDSLFRSKIKCSCGRTYYRVPAKNDYWECTGRKMVGVGCDNYIFYHEEIVNAWDRMCRKLRSHADEILTPIMIQLEMMEKAIQGNEIASLQLQADDLRQRRYMLCKLCAEGCIEREKFLTAETELDAEIQRITSRIEKIRSYADDTAEQIETVYRAVSISAPEQLVNMILDHAVVDGRTISFHLIGGLVFREVL
jgi:hypothetical protein